MTPLLKDFAASLGGDVETVFYEFADSLRPASDTAAFLGSLTNYSLVFEGLRNRYVNRNLVGIIFVSDGIVNSGASPLSAASQISVPLFTLPVGDTSTRLDAAVNSLTGNREVVFNNYFPIEFSIIADQADGKPVQVTVTHNNKELLKQTIEIQGNRFARLFNVKGMADQKGLNKVVVSITPIDGEQNVVNNQRVFYFNVADEQKKVLIVSSAPHPDVSAIRKTLEGNLNYQVTEVVGEQNTPALTDYDLLVLHQIPSSGARSNQIPDIASKSRIPVWIIGGQQTHWASLNAIKSGVSVRLRGNSASDVTAVANENFPLFSVSRQESDFIKSMPPLQVPFADISVSAGVDILLYQKVGSVVSSQPLICFSSVNNQRWAFMIGEGLWRWRMYDYRTNRSHDRFDAFVSRMAQFLSQNADRSRFRLLYEPTHTELEPVRFTAELYNENFELVNSEPVDLVMMNELGHELRFAFMPDGSGYALNCGRLQPGEYTFTARVRSTKYPYSQSGKLTVDRYNPELANMKADHNLLRQLSLQTGGLMVHRDSLDQIAQFLDENNRLQSKYHYEENYIDLLEWKWLLLILLALMSLEWIIRKREGYY